MIVQLFFEGLKWFFDALIGTIQSFIPPPPGWVIDGFDMAGDLWSYVEAFDTWIPIDLAMVVVVAVVGAWLVGMLIGIARVIASYLTLGGGAT